MATRRCVFQTLLELGASPDYKDSYGLTPLYHTAVVGGDPCCCELLLHEHAAVSCQDENGWHEIHQVRGARPSPAILTGGAGVLGERPLRRSRGCPGRACRCFLSTGDPAQGPISVDEAHVSQIPPAAVELGGMSAVVVAEADPPGGSDEESLVDRGQGEETLCPRKQGQRAEEESAPREPCRGGMRGRSTTAAPPSRPPIG